MRKGCESLAMAEHHESKAAGLESLLDNAIFSDDDNAVEAIEAKVRKLEAPRPDEKDQRGACPLRQEPGEPGTPANLTDAEKKAVRRYVPAYSWEPHPYPPYSFANLAGIFGDTRNASNISRHATSARPRPNRRAA